MIKIIPLVLFISIQIFSFRADATSPVETHPSQDAYILAKELQDKYTGEPFFDYWFGKAAYDRGAYLDASFAFERVLIAEPKHQSARYHLALCYQKMHNKGRAETLLKPATKNKAMHRHYFFALSRGWDDNINNGTAANTFTFLDPFFLIPITIDFDDFGELLREFRQIEDEFTRVRVGGSLGRFITQTSSWFLSGQASHKKYDENKNKPFDTTKFLLKGGIAFKCRQKNSFRIPLSVESLRVDNNSFSESLRDIISMGVEYTMHHFTPHTWTLFVEGGGIRYNQNSNRDVDFFVTSLKWSYALPNFLAQFTSRGYGGIQSPKDRSEFGERHGNSFVGAGLTLDWNPFPTHTFYAGVDLQYRRYWDAFPLDERRYDHLRVLQLGWQWDFMKNLTLHTSYGFKDNGANIPILAYKKNIFEVAIEYHFK